MVGDSADDELGHVPCWLGQQVGGQAAKPPPRLDDLRPC